MTRRDDYKPARFAFHDELELAIVRGTRLQLVLKDSVGRQRTVDAKPVELQTTGVGEFLVYKDAGGLTETVRLDEIIDID